MGGALALFAVQTGQAGVASDVLFAGLLGVVGLALTVGPWLFRLASDLTEERAARVRSQERADVAAHLHDSVLQTLALMQKEYLYPEVADRRTPGAWEVTGKEDIYQLAHEKVKSTLSTHFPEYISAAADRRIRDRFPIRLAPQDMRAGNGRWS